jgi:hypothetical protein
MPRTPDIAAITQALNEYEETIKAAEQASRLGGGPKIGSFFLSNAKSYLVTAKQLMRRIRDKVPYSSGDKMMLSNAGSGWMVEGFPAAAACATTTSWSRPIIRGANI